MERKRTVERDVRRLIKPICDHIRTERLTRLVSSPPFWGERISAKGRGGSAALYGGQVRGEMEDAKTSTLTLFLSLLRPATNRRRGAKALWRQKTWRIRRAGWRKKRRE